MKKFLKKWFERPSNIYLVVFILIFASAGSILLFGSHAATSNKTPIQGLLDRGGLGGNTYSMPSSTVLSEINGVVANVSWAQLQASQGGAISSTNQLNSALQQVAQYNSTHSHQLEVKARIFAGTDSPTWAEKIDGWNPVNICNRQNGGSNCGNIGPFWTTDYDNAYKTFMIDLANATDANGYTYDNDPLLHDVTIAQCMTIYAEPFQRDDLNLGQVLYYTPSTDPQPNYTGLPYSVSNDENCLTDSVDNMGAAWKHTNISYSLNPFKPWTNATTQSSSPGESFTNTIMQHCRAVLGSQCTLENNSIRDSYIGQQNQSGNLYYDITNKGPDITYQTATSSSVGNLDNTVAWAAQIGANAIELPNGYSSLLTSAQMSTLSAALLANPMNGSTSPSPSISSLSPSSGLTTGGNSVSIGLANFPSGTPSSVTFGGTAGTGISRSGNTVNVTVPAHSAGAVTATVTIGSSSASSSYTYNNPVPQYPDLIVTSLSVSPSSPVIGDDVTFSMVVKNQGAAAVPSGTAIGGAFLIDGTDVTLERGFSSGLAVGNTVTLTANQGSGSNSHSYWIAVAGNHSLEGYVNDQGTITESNSSNNTLSQALNVPNPPPPQAPNPPTNVHSTSQTISSISLAWTASVPGNNGDPASQLTYYINRNGSLVGHTALGVTSYTDSGLSYATTYDYTIYAEDTANRASADSNGFTQATANLNCATPAAPGNFKGSASSDGTSVNLTWNAVTAIAPCAIAHYELEQNGVTIAQVNAPTTSYNVTNLTPATTYTFNVLAVTNDSHAGASSTVQVTTATVTSTIPPSAPTNLVALPVSDSQVNLSWTASTDPSSGIKDYQIERDGSVIGTTNTTSFGDSNLSANTSYTYIVIAVNGVNLTTASSARLVSLPYKHLVVVEGDPVVVVAEVQDQAVEHQVRLVLPH